MQSASKTQTRQLYSSFFFIHCQQDFFFFHAVHFMTAVRTTRFHRVQTIPPKKKKSYSFFFVSPIVIDHRSTAGGFERLIE